MESETHHNRLCDKNGKEFIIGKNVRLSEQGRDKIKP